MSTIIDKLKDKLGNFVLPITNTKAVYDDNGNRLDNTLTTIDSNASNALSVANSKASANLVSDIYNPSTTYSTGQYCIYDNTLWKSKVDNNLSNTPTEGTYWTATSVGKNLITTNGEGTYGYLGADDSFIPFKSGAFIDLLKYDSNAFKPKADIGWYLNSYNQAGISYLTYGSVDLSYVNKIIVEITEYYQNNSVSNPAYISINSNRITDFNASYDKKVLINGVGTYEINVSDLTGEKYISIMNSLNYSKLGETRIAVKSFDKS